MEPPTRLTRRRRARRGNKSPVRGIGLVAGVARRLGLWEPLYAHLAQRAFALACWRCVPQLEPHARAEQLLDDTLFIRVSSSAVASELVYVKDLLLAQLNQSLAQSMPEDGARRPIRRLQHRVGAVGDLPSFASWQERPRRQRPAPPRAPDVQVATALTQVGDSDVREALGALYVTACRAGRTR